MTNNILVYILTADDRSIRSGLEALTPANTLAEKLHGEVIAAVAGKDKANVADAAARGCSCVMFSDPVTFDVKNISAHAELLGKIIKREKPRMVLLGGTDTGNALAAITAFKFQTSVAPNVIAINYMEEKIVYTIPEYCGTILCDLVESNDGLQIATVKPGAFRYSKTGISGKIMQAQDSFSWPSDNIELIKRVNEISDAVNLEDARIVVSGGRGMGTRENFEWIIALAKVLGGEIGATRPVIEAGWISRDHQIGQSGSNITAKLYIAAGISGAPQHLAGITGADYIVAINNDENAPIFSVADMAIVGDAAKVLPVMIREIKKAQKMKAF
ncbi:MAG: electron transfer flavoprotein subunit alpha/FixB family protein [Bilifractor sp.]|jgi:electron transfer flavoprotein alpha subunit